MTREDILKRLAFWSEQVSLAHSGSLLLDPLNRIRFAIAVYQFQAAQQELKNHDR